MPMPCEVFLPDGETKSPLERDPIRRALHGHSVSDMESLIRPYESPERTTWINQSSQPILDEADSIRGCVLVTRDITEHKELVRELDEVVAATVEEKRVLIERLEAGVKELSTPIIEVWDDVLALPVIGTVDAQRGAEMTSRLLDEVVSRGVQWVIVDWTGVDTMDSQSAQHLLDLVRSVELVGAECILTGIRPAVATALLDLDVRFEHMRLLRNVKFGLRHCLGRLQHSRSKTKVQTKSARPS
jgi:rsbT co-antagonist protein RsbR